MADVRDNRHPHSHGICLSVGIVGFVTIIHRRQAHDYLLDDDGDVHVSGNVHRAFESGAQVGHHLLVKAQADVLGNLTRVTEHLVAIQVVELDGDEVERLM